MDPYSQLYFKTMYAKIQQTKCINLKSLIMLLIDIIHFIHKQKKTHTNVNENVQSEYK